MPRKKQPAPQRETFEDPVTKERVPVQEGMLLNKQLYARSSVRRSMSYGDRRVPHSRRRMTDAEVRGAMVTTLDSEGAAEIAHLTTIGLLALAAPSRPQFFRDLVVPEGWAKFESTGGGSFKVSAGSYQMFLGRVGTTFGARIPLGIVDVQIIAARGARALHVSVDDAAAPSRPDKVERMPGWTWYAGMDGAVARGIEAALAMLPPGWRVVHEPDESRWGGGGLPDFDARLDRRTMGLPAAGRGA